VIHGNCRQFSTISAVNIGFVVEFACSDSGSVNCKFVRFIKMATFSDQMRSFFQSSNKSREYQVHSSKVHSVAWNCDGRRLASGSFDKTVVTFVLDRDRLVSHEIMSFTMNV
jgi:WD40 repeat protein